MYVSPRITRLPYISAEKRLAGLDLRTLVKRADTGLSHGGQETWCWAPCYEDGETNGVSLMLQWACIVVASRPPLAWWLRLGLGERASLGVCASH